MLQNLYISKTIGILQRRSVQVALVLAIYWFFAPDLPVSYSQFLYTISLFIKDLLVWMMPVTVCFFIAHTVASFEKKAPLLIAALVFFEAFSNFSSVWFSYGAATLSADFIPAISQQPIESHFTALWRLPFIRPSWWAADKGCLAGLLLGCTAAFANSSRLSGFLKRGKGVMELILTRFFSRLIPLFVLGFVANMYQSALLERVFLQYSFLFVLMLVVLVTYLVFLFALSAGFQGRTMLTHISNLLPAGGLALSSGCSLSTMPFTIEGASKNLKNPDLAQAIIPATTNIQQIGDCIANTFLCFILYKSFYGEAPGIAMWLSFSAVFVFARFATAAILGGAIFIMLPIYETYLHFTPDMIAIILAFNVMLDPIITSSNVLANGALCRVFERFWGVMNRQKQPKFSQS